eukprot:s319_g13.t1
MAKGKLVAVGVVMKFSTPLVATRYAWRCTDFWGRKHWWLGWFPGEEMGSHSYLLAKLARVFRSETNPVVFDLFSRQKSDVAQESAPRLAETIHPLFSSACDSSLPSAAVAGCAGGCPGGHRGLRSLAKRCEWHTGDVQLSNPEGCAKKLRTLQTCGLMTEER